MGGIIRKPFKNLPRKPILTTSCKRNSHNHPDFLDKEVLLLRFNPLLKSLYNKFGAYNGVFDRAEDKEDLWNQIVFEFLRLVGEYDPKRGVDFPGYIKFHLQQRVYHYVTKVQKTTHKELQVYAEDFEEWTTSTTLVDSKELQDEAADKALERVEALASVKWDRLTDQQVRFIKAVIIEQKSVEIIATEWGITLRAVKALMEEVCDVLVDCYNENIE